MSQRCLTFKMVSLPATSYVSKCSIIRKDDSAHLILQLASYCIYVAMILYNIMSLNKIEKNQGK